MASRRSQPVLLAPGGASSGSALHLPGASSLPPLDDRLVTPETREEVVRGQRVYAAPALEPHADQHSALDYVLRAHVRDGYVASSDLLTRAAGDSDFATDACVRRAGTDPATGTRYLEELAFEIVSTQSLADITARAEDLTTRGVRRIVALFVKARDVRAWDAAQRAWRSLAPDAAITDPCLAVPLPVLPLVDAAAADDAVAQALVARGNVVLAAREAAAQTRSRAESVLAVLDARGVALDDATRARVLACADAATLAAWLARAATATTADDVFAAR